MHSIRRLAPHGALATLVLALACGRQPQPPAAKVPTDLAEPFWASESEARPHRARPLSEELRAAEAGKVLQLTAAEQEAMRASADVVRPVAAPRPADLATPTRIVTGLYSFTYHQESSTTHQPLDLTAFPVKAYVPNPVTGFDTLTGVGHEDGTFSIANVPVGNYWLALNRNFIWTSSDHVEWVTDLYGRNDVEGPTADPANVVMNAGNLSPWQESDELFLSVPNQGFTFPLGGLASAGVPATGDTALTGYTLDFYNNGFALLDATKGDQGYLTQLTTRAAGAERVRALGKIWSFPAVTMAPDASETKVNGAFLDAAQTSTMRLNWRRSALAGMAAQVNPSATVAGTELGLWTTPLGLGMGLPGTAFQLLTYDSGSTGASTDLDLGDVAYGNPFPASWSLLAETYFLFRTSYLAPGATTPATFLRSAYTATSTLPTATAPLAPLMSPPQNPRINGKDLFANQVAVGTSPTLTWDAPAFGAPTGYAVRLLELRNLSGSSQLVTRASFRTPLRTFTVPPGLMLPGSAYVFAITALRNAGVNAGEYPLRTTFPYSTAPLSSAIVAP